jgi:hypothetical protein
VVPKAAWVGFTAHNVVAADVDPDWVHSVLPRLALGPMFGRFPRRARRPGRRRAGRVRRGCWSRRTGPVPLPGLTPVDEADSPRLRRAERYRVDVRA